MADQTAAPAAAPAAPAATQTVAQNPCGSFFGGGGTTTTSTGGGDGTAPAAGAQGGLGGMLFPIAIFVIVFYFFILRPQNKRKKQQEALLSGISRGDQIVTISGVFGTVREVRDDSFMVEIADGVKIRVAKSAVQTKVTRTPAAEEKKD